MRNVPEKDKVLLEELETSMRENCDLNAFENFTSHNVNIRLRIELFFNFAANSSLERIG